MNESKLKKAIEALEYLSQNEEARWQYEERQKYLLDEASAADWAMERGHKEGLEKGMREKAREIARNMLKLGLDTAIVIQASGLSEQEIEQLSREDN